MNIQVKNATIGIIILLLIKSKKSKNCKPKILTSAHIPLPSEEGSPKAKLNKNTIKQVILRFHLNLSQTMDTMVSIKEIDEVNAANKTKTKKTQPTISPNGILLNTFGKVTNIRPGPAFNADWSPPEKAKTEGIIIRPAKNAIPVSKISIL